MSDMKCPICGEILQKYGEVDPDTGTSIVLGANCSKCGIGDSDIKLWQELIRTKELLEVESSEHELCHDAMVKRTEELERTRKALDVALDWLGQVATPEKCDDDLCREFTKRKLAEIKTALEQKDK